MDKNEHLVVPKAESWKMFNAISPRYDLLNRILSLGQDNGWRRQILRHLPPGKDLVVLDLATGTGDVAITLARENNVRMVYGVDMAQEMLKVGQGKIERLGLKDKIMLQSGDAQKLNFMDDTFDAVTISFGIRNVGDLRLGLMEMYRILKKGGRVVVLEFSIPENVFVRAGHWTYMNWVVPAVGFLFSGNFTAYRYLNQTVATFPYGERFCRILKQMGFVRAQAHPLMKGTATIYVAEK